jgi:type IV secretory pathway component VirB8
MSASDLQKKDDQTSIEDVDLETGEEDKDFEEHQAPIVQTTSFSEDDLKMARKQQDRCFWKVIGLLVVCCVVGATIGVIFGAM